MLYNDVMGKRVTIEEIANLAGVSITTVSFVLNNRDEQKISEETKRKFYKSSIFWVTDRVLSRRTSENPKRRKLSLSILLFPLSH